MVGAKGVTKMHFLQTLIQCLLNNIIFNDMAQAWLTQFLRKKLYTARAFSIPYVHRIKRTDALRLHQ